MRHITFAKLRLPLLSCVITLAALPRPAVVGRGDVTRDAPHTHDEIAGIINTGTNCSARMRRIADILDQRIDLLRKGDPQFPWSQANLFRETLELKDHILRNEEMALRIDEARLLILWSDEYTGTVCSEKEVHEKYLSGTLPQTVPH